MADLVKALEADLFGSREWAIDQYEDLRRVPEPAALTVVYRGLLRALSAFEREPVAAGTETREAPMTADDAALALVDSEARLSDAERAALAAVEPLRETILDAPDAKTQRALAPDYLEAFRAAWPAAKETLVADAILAALVESNLLAAGDASGARERHVRAGALYDEAGRILSARAKVGSLAWQESAASCWHRAAVECRATGDEEAARDREKEALKLGVGGAGWYR